MNSNEQGTALLKNRYQKPVVKQLGFPNLGEAEIDMSDFNFCTMLDHASHDNHVVGIIERSSGSKVSSKKRGYRRQHPSHRRYFRLRNTGI